MIICDEYLALAALSENPLHSTVDKRVATTPAAWMRALRSRHNIDNPQRVGQGRLIRIINQLSPADRAQLSNPDPELLTILDPRPFLDTSARLAVAYRLSYMAAEMAAAALFHQVPLHFASERNVPPGIRDLLRHENLPDIFVANAT